jgi:hypothetical protein
MHAWLGLVAFPLCLASAAVAQRTWIVDAGYNGHFLTVQDAVNAASDGDVILLQYSSGIVPSLDFTLTKGVAIIGDDGRPRAGAAGRLVISGLQAHQRVVLRSLEPDALLGSGTLRVSVQNCAGEVVIDNAWLTSDVPFGGSLGDSLNVQDSHRVHVHRSTLIGWPAIQVTRATVTSSESRLFGRSGGRFTGGNGTGVVAADSRMWMSGGSCFGGGSLDSRVGPGGIGLTLRASQVVAAATAFSGGSLLIPAPSVDLDAASWLTCDAATTSATPWAGAITNTSVVETGSVTGGLNGPGQPALFRIDAANGTAGAFAVSLTGAETPSPFGPLWLWQPGIAVLALGPMPLMATWTMPAAFPRGTPVAVQGLVIDQASVRLSTPLVSAVR